MSVRFCGRTTRNGAPCTNCVAANPLPLGPYIAPACKWHMTADERALHAALEAEWEARMARAAASERRIPACWSWPVNEDDRKRAAEEQWIGGWHTDRCAVCGGSSADVLDHDHRAGWVRGFICQSCNVREANSSKRIFRLYRKRNPATILGVWDRYCHPFYGLDRGQVNGRQTWRPFMVDGQGVVNYDAPSLANDPAHLVSAALLRMNTGPENSPAYGVAEAFEAGEEDGR